jgi:hypothetical protein
MSEVGRKFVPITVSVKADSPTNPLAGEIDVIVGLGLALTTLRPIEFDLPPPGAGLHTVTTAVPDAAIAEAGIVAVS